MIEILSLIEKIDEGLDKNSVNELYVRLSGKCSEELKNNLTKLTTLVIKKIDNEGLDKNILSIFKTGICNITLITLTYNILEKNTQITNDNIEMVLNFYDKYGANEERICAVGYYGCAEQLEILNPFLSYKLIMKAFELYPDVGKEFGLNYKYSNKDNEHITEKCPFCGGINAVAYYCVRQCERQKNSFPPAKLWMKCPNCDNFYTYNFPMQSVGEINGHYTKKENVEFIEPRFMLSEYNDTFLNLKKLSTGNEYLEIGIGNGEMLAVAQEFGYNVSGVEICKDDCERISYLLNIDIKNTDIIKYDTDKKYDVIVMGDVLEHVSEPVTLIQKAKKMLSDDGVLWLSTPNYNSSYARLQKYRYCMWFEVNHYTFVSKESMEKLLEKYDLEIVKYNMSNRYFGSMELFIKHKK